MATAPCTSARRISAETNMSDLSRMGAN
jgi:hypothetical protein